jgi:outer membrane receptor for ferric coprogen and ferric-rhodotorulic acid
LNQFAAQSGIYLASDAQLTAGKSSGAQRHLHLNEGFSRLLADAWATGRPSSQRQLHPTKIPEGDEMVVVGDINYGSMTEDTGSYTAACRQRHA